MSSSEITKLESRWRENPQGLTFAPLAEAYRKMRNIPRALEILTEGLGRHPDYIPASIVLGRCQLDLGDDAQAEAAFTRVLELDDENVIALKALAEIAERQGRLEEAGARLLSLLAIDRSNDEARIQLARVEELRKSGGVSRTPDSERDGASAIVRDDAVAADDFGSAADAGLELERAPEPALQVDDFERETEAPEEAPPLLADLEDNLQPLGEVEQLPDLVPDDLPPISDAVADATAMPGLVGQDFHEHSAGVVPLDDLAPGTASIDSLAELEEGEDILLEPSPTNEFQISSASDDWGASPDAARGSEYQLPSAAEDLATFARTESDSIAAEDLDSIAAELERAPEDPFGDPNLEGTPQHEDDADVHAVDSFGGMPDLAHAREEDAAFAPALADVVDEEGADAMSAGSASADASEALDDEDVAADFEEAVSFEPPVEFAPAALTSAAVLEEEGDEDDLDADLVVTESMAELFLRQGHRSEALRVYRALYRRDPDNLGLREKVDELETSLAAEEASVPASASYRAPDASRSVAAFLSSILEARPADPPTGWAEAAAPAPLSPEAPPASAPGEAAPTRPASDHLSLSAVFGEEGSPVPPATPGATVPSDDGISFDAFFGGDQTGGSPRARNASREDDDLDQFHAWLQNLKR